MISSGFISVISAKTENIFVDLFIPPKKRKGFKSGKTVGLPVFFNRYIGMPSDKNDYYSQINILLKRFSSDNSCFIFQESIDFSSNTSAIKKLVLAWDELKNLYTEKIFDYYVYKKIIPRIPALGFHTVVKSAFIETMNIFLMNKTLYSSTDYRELNVKFVLWLNTYLKNVFFDANFNINSKVLYIGDISTDEVFFLLMLYKIGCDIVYINSKDDNSFNIVDGKNKFSVVEYCDEREPVEKFLSNLKKVALVQTTENQIPVTNTRAAAYPTIVNAKTPKSYEEIANLCSSTVMIEATNAEGKIIGTGSGIAVSEDGIIVTNHHVLEGANLYTVKFENGNTYSTQTRLNFDIDKDIALIKINAFTQPMPICRADDVKRGLMVVALGSPLGLMNTISDGIVSGIRTVNNIDLIQTTTPISQGSSGGALVNMYGELIGVIFASVIDSQNINLAVPVKYLIELLNDNLTTLNIEISRKFSQLNIYGYNFTFDIFLGFDSNQKYFAGFKLSKLNRINFYQLASNNEFRKHVEKICIREISKILLDYNIRQFTITLGGANFSFGFSYQNGKITDAKWDFAI